MLVSVTYQINPAGIASENFGDETIVIHISKGRYYSLSKSAIFLWSALSQPVTCSVLTEQIIQTFGIDAVTAQKDTVDFISILKNEGLIVETSESTKLSNTNISASLPSENKVYEAPVIQTYTDMEDLILLDPVHDVNPKEGWPVKK